MKEYYKKIDTCKICGSDKLTDVIHVEPQFISATFVETNEGLEMARVKVPMTLVLCDVLKNPEGCGHLQMCEEVEPDLLYRQYFYRSSISTTMQDDLKKVIKDIQGKVDLKPNDIVIDIGANDCTMISFYPYNLRRTGFEPAENIDWSGVDKSIKIVNDYFSATPFEKLYPGEKAKALSCCAMFYDLSDPNSFVKQAQTILADDGLWCIQLSYLPLMIDNVNFYDICHEHLSYHSLSSLERLLEQNGLKVFDATTNPVNGGSLRTFVCHKGFTGFDSEESQARLAKLRQREEEMHLKDVKTYTDFFEVIMGLSDKVRGYISEKIANNESVLGLGASTKGNVLLQLFKIDKEILPYISERNPDKVGLRTLGSDIELISEEDARNKKPASMLVLPWYFKDEIVKREDAYLQGGGTLLIPMPYAHLVTKDGEVRL